MAAKVRAIRIHSHGGPEVLQLETIELPPPGPGEARVRHTAIGLNFSDINVRRGGFYQRRARYSCQGERFESDRFRKFQ